MPAAIRGGALRVEGPTTCRHQAEARVCFFARSRWVSGLFAFLPEFATGIRVSVRWPFGRCRSGHRVRRPFRASTRTRLGTAPIGGHFEKNIPPGVFGLNGALRRDGHRRQSPQNMSPRNK
jgi:hypothetical protein